MATFRYRIVFEHDQIYMVEIAQGEAVRHVERGFKNSMDAKGWAERQKA